MKNQDSVSKRLVPIGWVGMILSVPIFFLISQYSSEFVYLPFIISLILFGMPHGAVDHLVPRFIGNLNTNKSVLAIFVVYGFFGISYSILWFFNPFVSVIIFILLTIVHWGQGDNYVFSKSFGASYVRNSNLGMYLGILVKGSLPMILPYLFHKHKYIEVIRSIIGVFDYKTSILNTLNSSSFQSAVAMILICLIFLYVANAVRYWELNTLKIDLTEISILIFCFYILPPVYAIGIYFCFWHSLRHIGRLLESDDKLEKRNILTMGKRFVWISTPMTIGGIMIVAILSFVIGLEVNNAEKFLSIYLVGISVMTLPHFAVVTWMDMRQDVYKTTKET